MLVPRLDSVQARDSWALHRHPSISQQGVSKESSTQAAVEDKMQASSRAQDSSRGHMKMGRDAQVYIMRLDKNGADRRQEATHERCGACDA